MDELADYPGLINGSCVNQYPCFNPAPAQDACLYQYVTPVVSSRIVSFGGSAPSLTQTFAYKTTWSTPQNGNTLGLTWSSKSTNVTTADNILGKSHLTKYAYGYVVAPTVPFSNTTLPNQIPVESAISDYDWNNTTTPIRTVTKSWYDQYDLASESVQEAGKTSQTTYCYVGTNCVPSPVLSQLQEKDDYDFGATSPTRKTVTTYETFSGTPGIIAEAPCKTVVTDGSGNRYAETDYYYDGSATLCGTLSSAVPVANAVTVVAGTHDDSVFGQSSTTPRGNLTQKVRWASTGTSPTTTYAYDSTGQVVSITDACGNSTCADVSGTNHKTTLSYADAYTVFSGGQNVSYTPSGNTNAYLTKITDALGHKSNFTYDFYSGELTKSTDPNNQSTTYLYNDPFVRPTQVNFPDGGQKTIAYNDSPYNPSTPSPSVTTTTVISSGTNLVNTVAFDGMEHTVETILTSDPSGADYVNTSYYGTGEPYQVSNPHRTTSSSTDGTTTYTYDGLGRTTVVTEPDTSIVTTKYDQTSTNSNAICATVTDEAGSARQSCSDGLGRLIEVDEELGVGATPGSPGTGTVTIGGSEQTIPAVSGSASLSVSGGGVCIYNGHGGYYPETGTVSVTVYGVQTATGSTNWGGTCDAYGNFTLGPTLAQIASNLATSLTASAAGVNATSNNTTIQVTAKATGTSTDYALSPNETSTVNTNYVWVAAPSSLTGGANGYSDSGTVSLNVGGFQVSYSYGSGDSATSIANALASQLNSAGSPVTSQGVCIVSPPSCTMTLTAKVAGSASNYSLSGSTTWNTQHFSTPSFNISDSGSTLTGGSDASPGAPLVTLYAYDVLNNLTCAVQKGTDTTAFATCSAASPTWRPRSFVYDSLSRLTSATNPESGTLTYSYDANGNVSAKASPQVGATSGTAVTTVSYTYDNDNRLTKKTYTNPASPTVQFGYDGTAISGCAVAPPSISSPTNRTGRRSAMCSAASASSWSYDPMGRVLQESRKNVGSSAKTLAVNYLYNTDGSVHLIAYPSGRVLYYTVSGAGRVTQIDDTYDTFIATATYTPAGAFATGVKGATNVNNVYNSRQQPILLSAATAGGGSVFSLCYDFHLGQPINTPPCQFSGTSGDSGNVFQIVDNTSADATNRSVFQYDALNRILQANSAATSGTNCWGEAYTIDNWGNLTNKGGASGMGGCYTLTMSNPANVQNHLTGLSYDIAGNVLNDPLGNAVTYDAESRVATDAGYTYSYDADGLRMAKANGSAGTMYWPGPNGVVAETDLTGTINEEYIYFNGERIARVDRPSGTVHYYYSDHLRSARLITDASANVTERYFDDPYGSALFTSGSDPNHYKFTGKERDAESGLDMFGARYYGSSLGRFMTPDWAAKPINVPYANFGNPQSLNLYSYVENNPTTTGDPDGHCPTVWECVVAGSEAVGGGLSWAASGAAAGVGLLVNLGAEMIADPTGANFAKAPPGGMGMMNADGMLPEAHRAMNAQQSTQQTQSPEASQSTPAQPPDDENGKDTTRAARREAMRQEGIPTSQQPTSQVSTEAGRQYTYEVPKSGGGTQTKIVTNQLKDANHGPHVEAGAPKANRQTDPSGRLRHANPKTKVDVNQ